MSEEASRWLKIGLGPFLFLLAELLFRPDVSGIATGAAALDPVLVRHALAVTLWVAAWWFTEALPIPATSLLPIALFPLLGLATAKDVAREYAHEIIFLFLGGFLLALAMERTELHRRVALKIIGLFGNQPRALVLGFMCATAVMSMWLSNTATTVMLLPVALAVLATRCDGERQGNGEKPAVDEPFGVALLLGIAFAANIGGLGTPVGSPPNIIFQSVFRQKTGTEVSFLEWMLYGLPIMAVLLPLTWWRLVRKLGRPDEETAHALPTLPRASWGEKWVFGVFMVTVAAWTTRGNFGELQGWGARLAEHGLVLRDSTVAVAAALVLFIVPARKSGGKPILDWSVGPRLPWGVLLLMGAGFALSAAFDTSGLTLWIGKQLEGVGMLPLPDAILFPTVLLAVIVVSIVVTEFASNTASANILLPVIFGISVALGAERFPPEILMVACALACTTGFAVPAGTPPNALVFGTERISIRRFVRTGLWIDLLAMVTILVLLGWRA